MTEKWEEAEQDYLAGMKIKDIATKYGVKPATIRSWKSRKWATHNKDGPTKSVATKSKALQSVATQNNVADVIDELDEYGLTDKQNLFVVQYLKSFNATQAYMDAYGVDYQSANRSGSRLLVNVDIQSAIKRIKAARLKDVAVEEEDIIAQWAKQSFADIGDYVNFGGQDEMELNESGTPRLDTDDNPIIRHRSYVQLKSKSDVDTTAIKKITVGKDGPIVELYDKAKAQEKLLNLLRGVDDAKARKTITDANMAEAKLEQITAKQDDIETGLTNVMDLLMKGDENDGNA